MKLTAVIAFLTLHSFAYAQSNYIDAVIISPKGDSISGKMNYRNWKNNPQYVNFQNSANEKSMLEPGAVRAIYFPSIQETYASYNVDMDMLPGDKDAAIRNVTIDSPTVKRTVFLLQLVGNKDLTLYQYHTMLKDHFYYVKGDAQPVELIDNFSFNDMNNQVSENAAYKTQLSGLFTSCAAVAQKAGNLKFNSGAMKAIFTEYLQCSSPGSVIEVKAKDAIPVKFGVVGGVSLNSFDFTGSSNLASDNYSSSTSIVLGGSIDVGLSRNRNRWHIVNELIYKQYKTGAVFTKPTGNGYTVMNDVNFQLSYAQLNSMIRYVFYENPSIKAYFNLGMGNAFMVGEKKNDNHLTYSYGDEEDKTAIEDIKKYEFSLQGGAGVSFKRVFLEFRYGFNKKGFSPSFALDTNPRSLQFLVTYQF